MTEDNDNILCKLEAPNETIGGENKIMIRNKLTLFQCVYITVLLALDVLDAKPSLVMLAHDVRMMPVCVVWAPLDHRQR